MEIHPLFQVESVLLIGQLLDSAKIGPEMMPQSIVFAFSKVLFLKGRPTSWRSKIGPGRKWVQVDAKAIKTVQPIPAA